MTSKDNDQDPKLLDRYRRASDTGPVAPNEAVRGAILAEGRRVAGQLAAKGAPTHFDAARRAANDSRWKFTAFGTAGAAVLAALLFAPRYWEGVPSPQTESNSTTSDASPQPRISSDSAPTATAPRAADGPAPKLESIAPIALTPERKISKPMLSYAPPSPPLALRPAPAGSSDRALQGGLSVSVARAERGRRPGAPAPENLPAAAAAGDLEQATLLLDQGSAVDLRDAQGRTPLLLAVEQNRFAVVRLLLARGADPNAADNAGRTPLQQAKSKDLREIAGILEDAGAR